MTVKDKISTKRVAGLDEIKPELDDDWFAEADAYIGAKLVRRGRPKSDSPKQPVSLRLDRDVVDWFKSKGSGWQSRINEELRKAAGL
jgi:uncharacterized protein (DUF4415 family)